MANKKDPTLRWGECVASAFALTSYVGQAPSWTPAYALRQAHTFALLSFGVQAGLRRTGEPVTFGQVLVQLWEMANKKDPT